MLVILGNSDSNGKFIEALRESVDDKLLQVDESYKGSLGKTFAFLQLNPGNENERPVTLNIINIEHWAIQKGAGQHVENLIQEADAVIQLSPLSEKLEHACADKLIKTWDESSQITPLQLIRKTIQEAEELEPIPYEEATKQTDATSSPQQQKIGRAIKEVGQKFIEGTFSLFKSRPKTKPSGSEGTELEEMKSSKTENKGEEEKSTPKPPGRRQ